MTADEILNRVAVAQQLERIENPERRMVLLLHYGLACPDDFPRDPDAKWPPTFEAIGAYVGRKFRGAPLSEGAIRYIHDQTLDFLGGDAADTRKNRKRRTADAADPPHDPAPCHACGRCAACGQAHGE